MSLAAYSSFAKEENSSSSAANPLAVFDTQINKLTEDVDKLENDTTRMSQDDFNTTNKGYIDLFKQIELDLNRGIVTYDGKTRMGIIRQQKVLGALKKRFEGIMYMKGRFFEDGGNVAVPIGEDEKEEEEDFGLINGSTVQKRNFAKKDSKEDRKAQMDRELIKSIMQDMKEISEKQAKAAEVHVFNVEETPQKTEKVKKQKIGYSGFTQPIVIVLMVILLLTFIILH